MDKLFDKKGIYGIVLFLFLMTCTVFASEIDSRWVYVGKDNRDVMYYDRQTAQYNPDTHSITIWRKVISDGKPLCIGQYHIFLDRREYQGIKHAIYDKNTGERRIIKQSQYPMEKIAPDSDIEKAADDVCDQYGISHMSSNAADRWNWIYSSATQTCMYAKDFITIDRVNKTVEIWVRATNLNGFTFRPVLYTCHIDDQTVDYAGYKGIAKGLDIFPETIEEAVWNKAKELYFKK